MRAEICGTRPNPRVLAVLRKGALLTRCPPGLSQHASGLSQHAPGLSQHAPRVRIKGGDTRGCCSWRAVPGDGYRCWAYALCPYTTANNAIHWIIAEPTCDFEVALRPSASPSSNERHRRHRRRGDAAALVRRWHRERASLGWWRGVTSSDIQSSPPEVRRPLCITAPIVSWLDLGTSSEATTIPLTALGQERA